MTANTNVNITDLDPAWQALAIENESARLQADLCASDPASYTIAEKQTICSRIDASNDAIDAALRTAFESDPPELQAAMLDLLEKADPANFQWWLSVLVGNTPDAPPAR